jgi:hypothetical protein
MTKPKAQTLQQRLGFLDSDLKSPVHDEIMIWLDENVEKIINDLFFKPWPKEELQKIEKDCLSLIPKVVLHRKKAITALREPIFDAEPQEDTEERIALEETKIRNLESWTGFSDYPERPKLQVLAKVWEDPVFKFDGRNNANKYLIGFVDMKIKFNDYSVGYDGFFKEQDRLDKTSLNIAGFPKWKISAHEQSIFIEVKTQIKSLGELIRQIKMYQAYQSGNYYVVSPDDNHRELLNQQGIGFIKYSPLS